MPLTIDSNVFYATFEQAKELAESWVNLRMYVWCDSGEKPAYRCEHDNYTLWEDSQTRGGGCRIVWRDGILWISRHSGYEYADQTDNAREIAEFLGLHNADKYDKKACHNPHIYPEFWRQ